MTLTVISNTFPFDVSWLNGSIGLQLTQTLVHFAWQGIVIGLLFLFANWILKQHSANVRYIAGVVALTVMGLCPPLTYGLLPLPSHGLRMAGNATSQIDTDKIVPSSASNTATLGMSIPRFPQIEVSRSGSRAELLQQPTSGKFIEVMSPLVVTVYLTGVVIMLLRLAIGLGAAFRLRSASVEIIDEPILKMVHQRCELWSMHVVPVVAYCHQVTVPVVIGVMRPMILLPSALMSGQSIEQLEALLIHEIAHIRRWDLAINLAQRVVEALLFMHPAVWYVSRRISVERENACDDLVLAAGCHPNDYVGALLNLADLCILSQGQRLTSLSSLAASGDRPSQLKQRVLRLLGEPAKSSTRPSHSGFGALTAAAVLLALASIVLAYSHPVCGQRSTMTVAAMIHEPVINEMGHPTKGTEEYLAATTLFQEGKYDEARRALKTIARQFKKSALREEREDALFMQAESAWNLAEYYKAHDTYTILLNEFPSTKHLNIISERLFHIGRLWLEIPEAAKTSTILQVNSDESKKALPSENPQKVPKLVPIFDRNSGDKQQQLFDLTGRGIAALTAVWANDPTGPLADDAMMVVACYYARQGDDIEADRFFQMLRETFPNSPHVESACVRSVEYKGCNEIRRKYLDQLIGLKAGDPYNVETNNKNILRIKQSYRRMSYPLARVELEKGNHHDSRDVIFSISEGPKVKIRAVKFQGNKELKSELLDRLARSPMQTLGIFGTRYDFTSITDGIRSIKQFYHHRGYFKVDIQEQWKCVEDRPQDGIQFHEIQFQIAEGPRHKIRNIEMIGNNLMTEDELRRITNVASGDYFSGRDINQDVSKIALEYFNRGFPFCHVEAGHRYEKGDDHIDIQFKIAEVEPSPKVRMSDFTENLRARYIFIPRALYVEPVNRDESRVDPPAPKELPNVPDSDRMRDELLKIEDAKALVIWKTVEFYVRNKKPNAAAIHCQELVAKYPKSTYADKARAKLAEFDAEFESGLKLIPSSDVSESENRPFESTLALDGPIVDVSIEGNSAIPSAEIVKHLKVRKGQSVTQKQIKDDVDALVRTRWFATVDPIMRSTDDGTVLVYQVLERPIVRRVEYKGLKHVKQKTFDMLTLLKAGSPYDIASNRECARRIEEYYHEKGFAFATVELEKGAECDGCEVVFMIHEGPKVKVTNVNFEGNSAGASSVLETKTRVKTVIATVFSGKFDRSSVDDDIENIKQYYHSLGHFDVEITHEGKNSDDKSRMEIYYHIKEGVRYKIRKIEIVGNNVLSEEEMRDMMKVTSDTYFNGRDINADVETIKSKYGSQGRIFCRVEAVPRWTEDPGIVDVVYKIEEDNVYRISTPVIHLINSDAAHVIGSGTLQINNSDTQSDFVRKAGPIQPGDLADPKKITEFKRRLESKKTDATPTTDEN